MFSDILSMRASVICCSQSDANPIPPKPPVLGRIKTRAQSLAGLRPISFTGSFSRWRPIQVTGVGGLGAWLRNPPQPQQV
jgi:hypothetical protein